MFPKYPYLDLSDRNLDFLTKAIREMENEVKNFVSINAIKYANPIDWSINRQYEKNTVVIDANTGVAYLSVKEVPRGVNIARTDYWTVIFDLSNFIEAGVKNLASSYEPTLTYAATVATNKGGWVVWNGTLYEALNDIHIGDMYVVNGNIKKKPVEEFVNDAVEILRELINGEIRDREDADAALGGRIDDEIRDREDADTTLEEADTALGGRIDDEIRDREDADTALGGRIDDEIRDREDADTALGGRIDDEIRDREDADTALDEKIDSVIDKVIAINVLSLGVKNDASTDSSGIINTYIASHDNCSLYFPNGRYLFNNTINLTDKKIDIIGQSEFNTIFIYNNSGSLFSDRHSGDPLVEHYHKTFTNFTCKVPNGTCFDMYCVAQRVFKNIHFDDCLNGFHIEGSDGIYINNILQNGSLYNEWAFGGQVGKYWFFNWDTVIDGWVTESNDNPRTAKPWFTMSGMVCSYINNITTHGRLETIAFDLIGHNEGTFFTNVILVCPTWGITCHPDANNNLPACVECNNFSIDQPFQGGVFFDGQWFMLDNFSIVNGNQRGNTDSAIVLGEDITEVWISNGIIYNWNGSAINMDRSTRVSFTGVVVHDITDTGSGAYAYINPSQTVNNPKICNCDFDGTIAIPAGLTFTNTSSQIST